MKIVVAPDSYKGSLSAVQVSKIINKAIVDVDHSAQVLLKPMADGGEGTIESFLTGMTGRKVPITCLGPLGHKITSYYAIVDSDTAIIECAIIAGLVQVPNKKRNPEFTTSFGLGEAIIDALDNGCKKIIIGLGGSATNDGGLGMLQALGMQAWNKEGELVEIFGKDVLGIERVCFSEIDPRIFKTKIQVASDVNNPLNGESGATRIYGPQKGLREQEFDKYDMALENYGKLIEEEVQKSLRNLPGAGAAGGLGFALMAVNAEMISGAELIGNAIEIENAIKKSDLVITGEGQSDQQTLFGKAPGHIATLAQKYNVPVLLLSGSLMGELEELRDRFSAFFSIINKPLSLEMCIENADTLLYEQTRQIFSLLHSVDYKKRYSQLK